ncbi:hemerythrin domain-containing protein [Streptomyces xiamenensis]|uniref:Hemerythrin hhe cation binding domain-containing protein n=1 Tax=Streptomyces xiamenensis TaxID=408015 RepID=A0A0F7FRX3_9ACTN|nr:MULTISPECIES: hemerythrin domain-containing protein [Streptomyces]AKG43027.1 hemerythrin hhe cation binding domain-containing protein [Streptomyces xiamenensis]
MLTMVLAHRAMLRDLDRIARTATALAKTPDPDRTRALVAYARRLTELIHHHHEGEDEVLWPVLRERGADEEALSLLQEEHAALEGKLAAFGEAIEALSPDGTGAEALADAATAVRELLAVHTADEERELAGRLAPALNAKVWARFEKSMVTSAARWTLTFMPPWLASVAEPSERAGIPARPVAALMRGSLERRQRSAFGDQY